MTRIALYPTRAQDLIPRSKSVWLLTVVHAVGFVGFALWPEAFQRLVPLHLIVCLAVWLVNQPKRTAALASYFVCCGVFGFGAEVLGVRSAALFGAYTYGDSLGPAIFDVPVMMAVNWSLLTAIVADVSSEVRAARGFGPTGGALVGAITLVALDGFLERFAVRYDLWRWALGAVPAQNYVGWALVSFVLLLPYHGRRLRPNNPISGPLLLLLFVFFAASALIDPGAP